MFGQRLWVLILTLMAFAVTTFLVVANYFPSWSQHAGTKLEPLFIIMMWGISTLFMMKANIDFDKDRVLFKVRKMELRVKHINRITGVMFGLIMAFAVWNYEIPHFIFTGLAIMFAHLEIWTFYKQGIKAWSWRTASVISIVGFCGGFFFHWYSIGMGESIVALPVIVFVLRHEIVTLTKNKK